MVVLVPPSVIEHERIFALLVFGCFFFNSLVLLLHVKKFFNPDELIVTELELKERQMVLTRPLLFLRHLLP